MKYRVTNNFTQSNVLSPEVARMCTDSATNLADIDVFTEAVRLGTRIEDARDDVIA